MNPLDSAAQKFFGIPYLYPYQRLVVANILEVAQYAGLSINWNGAEKISGFSSDNEGYGRNQIVILPTGAGKSLCFQLPSVMLSGATLVIYPILSLMTDQERRLQEKNINPVTIRGGQSAEERDLIWKKIKKGESRFIIANPETLITPRVLKKLPELDIAHVVIDEAHCVSEWGESFRPAYLKIGEIITAMKKEGKNLPVVTAFTATASAPVLEKIEKIIFNGEGSLHITGNPDRSNISYTARACLMKDRAVREIIQENQRPALVFCATRAGTETLARSLRNELADKEIKFYHAGLSREEKNDIEKWYLKNSRAILVATCAFGMGVDKADIRIVIHRDCPPSVEAYLQESGRAGRDGLPSKAVLLQHPEDRRRLTVGKTETEQGRLSALLDYAEDIYHCRRENLLKLLNYEGEPPSTPMDCCDVCNKTAKGGLQEDWIVDFFKKRPRIYTVSESALVLSQAVNKAWTETDIKKAIYALIDQGILAEINNFFWKHKIFAPE